MYHLVVIPHAKCNWIRHMQLASCLGFQWLPYYATAQVAVRPSVMITVKQEQIEWCTIFVESQDFKVLQDIWGVSDFFQVWTILLSVFIIDWEHASVTSSTIARSLQTRLPARSRHWHWYIYNSLSKRSSIFNTC